MDGISLTRSGVHFFEQFDVMILMIFFYERV